MESLGKSVSCGKGEYAVKCYTTGFGGCGTRKTSAGLGCKRGCRGFAGKMFGNVPYTPWSGFAGKVSGKVPYTPWSGFAGKVSGKVLYTPWSGFAGKVSGKFPYTPWSSGKNVAICCKKIGRDNYDG